MSRGRVIRAILAVAIIAACAYSLRKYLAGVPEALRTLHPNWSLIALASGIVCAVYVLLVETWRIIVVSLGAPLRFRDALWVWFLSNLARYSPVPLLQVPLLSYLAKRLGVQVTVSAASSVIVAVLNILTGFAIFTALESGALFGSGLLARTVIAVVVAALMLAALYTPRLLAWASRLVRRPIDVPDLSGRALAAGLIGTGIAWVGYGLAFQVFTVAVFNRSVSPGALAAFVAVYTGQYLAGFLSIVTPAGAGVAEFVLVRLAPQIGLGDPTTATLLALLVRAWRTILEIAPGLAVLPLARRLRPESGVLSGAGN